MGIFIYLFIWRLCSVLLPAMGIVQELLLLASDEK